MTQPIKRRGVLQAAPVFVAALVAVFIFLIQAGGGATSASAAETGPCAEPVTNPVACENTKEGDPPANW